jgi:hypothetical protein
MKHSILLGLSEIFLLIVISSSSYGQIAKSNHDSTELEGKFKHSKLYTNAISTRAKRDLYTRYKNAANEKWTSTNEGFNASFTSGEIKYRVYYNKKGYRLFTIRSYPEKYLLKDIRTQVRSSYFDYNIRWVEEIEKIFNPLVYVVLLEGEKEWIKLRIGDGEMSEWEKIDK